MFFWVGGVLVSALPGRLRAWYGDDEELWGAAAFSGLAQYSACTLLVLISYVHFMEHALGILGHTTMAQSGEALLATPVVQYGMGFAVMLQALARPLIPILLYLVVEGLLRFVAAVVTHEVLGTLPICFIAWSYRYLRQLQSQV
jgi:hypothetical protein